MIKQEQQNAAQNQTTQAVNQTQVQATQQTIQKPIEQAQQSQPQANKSGVISSVYTIASSNDENLNKEEFSLKSAIFVIIGSFAFFCI